jgi:hypothetical protein
MVAQAFRYGCGVVALILSQTEDLGGARFGRDTIRCATERT